MRDYARGTILLQHCCEHGTLTPTPRSQRSIEPDAQNGRCEALQMRGTVRWYRRTAMGESNEGPGYRNMDSFGVSCSHMRWGPSDNAVGGPLAGHATSPGGHRLKAFPARRLWESQMPWRKPYYDRIGEWAESYLMAGYGVRPRQGGSSSVMHAGAPDCTIAAGDFPTPRGSACTEHFASRFAGGRSLPACAMMEAAERQRGFVPVPA